MEFYKNGKYNIIFDEVLCAYAAFPFKDVEISQINGNMDSSEVNIKAMCIFSFFIVDISFFQKTECL